MIVKSTIDRVSTQTGKPGKLENIFQGKVREFWTDWKSQEILPKILEKWGNFNQLLFLFLWFYNLNTFVKYTSGQPVLCTECCVHPPGSTEGITFSRQSESWLLILSMSIVDLPLPMINRGNCLYVDCWSVCPPPRINRGDCFSIDGRSSIASTSIVNPLYVNR